jgi:hypothetical protein
MRDDQVRRYARHLALPEIGGLGQTALLVAAARVPLPESDPIAELIAATFLAAGGVGTLVVPNASERQRSDLAAHGADTRVIENGAGRDVTLSRPPAWWPGAAHDTMALAFWRGGVAATRWMAETAQR